MRRPLLPVSLTGLARAFRLLAIAIDGQDVGSPTLSGSIPSW